MKLRLNGAGIGQFFAANGEKIVLGITAIIALFFLYGAITAKPLDDSKSAHAIVTESEQAKQRMEASAPPTADFAPLKIEEIYTENQKPVPETLLAFNKHLDPAPFAELSKRPEPVLYTVEELQIAAGHGVVAYSRDPSAVAATAAAPGGVAAPAAVALPKLTGDMAIPGVRAPNAEARAISYAIITGLVPEEKETLEFKRCFEYAVKPGTDAAAASGASPGLPDVPHYYFFRAQRAEVQPGNPNLQWVDLDWHLLLPDGGKPEAVSKWQVPYPEIVDTPYVLDAAVSGQLNLYITWPLPPLFVNYWGLDAGHAPKVPFLKTNDTQATPAPGNNNNPLPAPAIGPNGVPLPVPAGGAMAAMDTVHAADTSTPPSVPHRLFRFVDTSVEKGKTYRYRIQLALRNPNFGVKGDLLEKPASTKDPVKFSDWSEPTAAVTVPRDQRILADSVSAKTEPIGKIHLLGLVKEEKKDITTNNWFEVAKEFDISLGGFIWFNKVTFDKVIDMTTEEYDKKFTVENVNVDTSMLLDMRNDEPLGKGTKGPAEMLFLDNQGRIFTADSSVDGLALKDFQQRTNTSAQPAAGAAPVAPPQMMGPRKGPLGPARPDMGG
jgi:hypothetical protein